MILGIDLGTTYSVGAYLDEQGKPVVVPNMEGTQTTPSVVYFEKDDSVIVGQVAKDNVMLHHQDVVVAVKNEMGTKKVYQVNSGKQYTPEVVSSFILKKVVSDASKRLGEQVRDVVVTIPAYFTDSQRKATENAVQIAGLNLVGMINEPTAAALYYAVSSKMNHANILVYDLGGGTFDVTVIRIDDDNVVVKSTGGLSGVGGRFFDEAIVEYVESEIEDEYDDIDLEDDQYADVRQDLYDKAERAKCQLSSMERANITVRVDSVRENVEITRAWFEKKVSVLYKRTEAIVKDAMEEAQLEFSDLDKVLLVGGSTKIPYFERKLAELTGMEPSHEVHPDLVVAQGAALFGRQLTVQKESIGKDARTIQDVCSHGIGILGFVQGTYQKKNAILIRRNTQIPAQGEIKFRTAVDNQERFDLTITEGDFEEADSVREISEGGIQLPPGLAKGTPGEVVLRLDSSALIHVFIKIPSADYEEEFMFRRKDNLPERTVDLYEMVTSDYEVS